MTHEIVSRQHRILGHCLPPYFPEKARFRRGTPAERRGNERPSVAFGTRGMSLAPTTLPYLLVCSNVIAIRSIIYLIYPLQPCKFAK